MRQHDGQRHQLLGLVAGETKHQPLVAGAARVDAHRDVRGLAVNRRQHGAGLGIEAVLAARVPDLRDRRPHDVLVIDHGRGRDLAGEDGEAGRHQRLAGHATHRVLGENRVENSIRDLIGDLVGVSFRNRLRREKVARVTAHALLLEQKIEGVKQLSLADHGRGWKRS